MAFIKRCFVKLFRNGLTSVIVIIGLCVSFVMFLYYDIAGRIEVSETEDVEKYNYKYTQSCLVYGDDVNFSALYDNSFDECGAMLINCDLYVGKDNVFRRTDIVVGNKSPEYPIVTGRYPTNEELNSGVSYVMLGTKLKSYTYDKNGRDYVTINGDEYCVSGYISTRTSVIYDYEVLIFYNNLSPAVLRDIKRDMVQPGIELIAFSNTLTAEQITDRLNTFLEDNSGGDNSSYADLMLAGSGMWMASGSYSDDFKNMTFIIYAFSIMLVILVINYWYEVNKREFYIRRAYGYSVYNIFIMVVARIIGYLFVSIVISEMLFAVLRNVEGSIVSNVWDDISVHATQLGLYIVVTLPVVAVIPFINLCRAKPINLIRRV